LVPVGAVTYKVGLKIQLSIESSGLHTLSVLAAGEGMIDPKQHTSDARGAQMRGSFEYAGAL
jgi:hypothetical protein